jgi:hypothetical protein
MRPMKREQGITNNSINTKNALHCFHTTDHEPHGLGVCFFRVKYKTEAEACSAHSPMQKQESEQCI